MNLPAKLPELAALLAAHGWSFVVMHGIDTGNSPFVSVEAKKTGHPKLYITWHTRGTGTYRLFTCMAGQRRTTLATALHSIAKEDA